MTDDDTLPSRPRIAYLFRVLHEQFALEIDIALREAGFGDIHPGQAKVFPFVPDEGIPVKELAALAGVRKQTMAQAVDQLVRSGYLERRPNPHDARSRLILLTPRGRSARPVAVKSGQAIEDRWAELIGASDLEAIRRDLRRLLERIRHDKASAPQPSEG